MHPTTGSAGPVPARASQRAHGLTDCEMRVLLCEGVLDEVVMMAEVYMVMRST